MMTIAIGMKRIGVMARKPPENRVWAQRGFRTTWTTARLVSTVEQATYERFHVANAGEVVVPDQAAVTSDLPDCQGTALAVPLGTRRIAASAVGSRIGLVGNNRRLATAFPAGH